MLSYDEDAHAALVLASGVDAFDLTQKYRISPNKFALIFIVYE